MDYEHHIFISYAHGQLWTPWVREVFVPRLHGFLEIEVGRLELFVDDQIQTGARWDAVLKRKVARSKLMIPLLSANYFQREYCRRELSLMLEREATLGRVSSDENYGFVIPVRLGDGMCFPEIVNRIQYQDFEAFADPDLPAGSPRASEFNRSLKKLAQTVARTLPLVPTSCESWQGHSGDSFYTEVAPRPLAFPQPPRLIV